MNQMPRSLGAEVQAVEVQQLSRTTPCRHDGTNSCIQCEHLTPSARRTLRCVAQLSGVQRSQATPLIRRLAYAGRLTLLAGREGSGKSTLLRAAIAASTRGKDWLDPEVSADPVPIIWVGEERPEDIRAEFDAFDIDHDMIHVVSVDDVSSAGDLQAVMDALDVRLAVVDPIADLLRLKDERNYSAVRLALRLLSPRDPNTAIVGVMHAHREREVRTTVGGMGHHDSYLSTRPAPKRGRVLM